ncbi:MAG: hypothetical protein OCC49_10475 [Fibrobacterales bacterium]
MKPFYIILTICLISSITFINCDNNVATDPNTYTSTSDSTGVVIDYRDGQEYNWVVIGTQTWLAEDLRYSTDEYPAVTIKETVDSLEVIGVLYSLETTGLDKGEDYVCLEGWHIPSAQEWQTLKEYLGGDWYVVAHTLKSVEGWKEEMVGDDSVLFGATPNGFLSETIASPYNEHTDFEYYAHYWSSTPMDNGQIITAGLDDTFGLTDEPDGYFGNRTSFSVEGVVHYGVRCLKN